MAEETKNVCMRENGRLYVFCYRDDAWKEKEVCKVVCSEGGRKRCPSWRKHVDGNTIGHRRTNREVAKEKEIVSA
jgi:hypothetical protein